MSERDLTRLRLIIFQVVNISKIDEPYTDRRERAVELAEAIGSKAISAIPVQTVSSYDEFQQAFNLHVASGCDGVMLKLRTGVYEQRRSPLWLKVKPYFEINGKIVGFKEGIGKYKDTLGSIGIVLPLPNGRWETEVTHVSGMTDAERNLIWENRKRFLGRVIEVAYRAKSADGLLIEPRVIPNKIGL